MTIESYLYDKMINNRYRPFLHQYYTEADFEEGTGYYERLGIGLEYRHKGHKVDIELSDSYSSQSDPGFSVHSEHHLSDILKLSLGYDSFSTNVPVRAYYHDIDGYHRYVFKDFILSFQ